MTKSNSVLHTGFNDNNKNVTLWTQAAFSFKWRHFFFFHIIFQNPRAWRNFFLKTGKRRWRGSTPVNCWQKSKVGPHQTKQISRTNTSLIRINKSLIPIRPTLSMCCIISDAALYFQIKQRPLAALLIHFSPLLSFVGMPDSVQSAVFRIPTHLYPFAGSTCLSGLYCCCPFWTSPRPSLPQPWYMWYDPVARATVAADVRLV